MLLRSGTGEGFKGVACSLGCEGQLRIGRELELEKNRSRYLYATKAFVCGCSMVQGVGWLYK